MFRIKKVDEDTSKIRESIIKKKSAKSCLKDFSGDVFELTSDMLVLGKYFDKNETKELTGIAERILHKYSKLLSVTK